MSSTTPDCVSSCKGTTKLNKGRKDDPIDSLTLINQVQLFNCLYDPFSPHYKHKATVLEAWDSICRNMVGEDRWENLTFTEKRKISNALRHRWKSILDSYNKSFEAKGQKTPCRKSCRKPYIYEKEMQFVLPAKLLKQLEIRPDTDNNCSVIEDGQVELDNAAYMPSCNVIEDGVVVELDSTDKLPTFSQLEDEVVQLDSSGNVSSSIVTLVDTTDQKHPGRKSQSLNLMTKQNAPSVVRPTLAQPTAVCQPTTQQTSVSQPTTQQTDVGQPTTQQTGVCQPTTQQTAVCQPTTQRTSVHQLTFQPTGLQHSTAPHNEEDKMFLLSLLPHMQEMSNNDKLDFKINVMQSLKTIANKRKKATQLFRISEAEVPEKFKIIKPPIIKNYNQNKCPSSKPTPS